MSIIKERSEVLKIVLIGESGVGKTCLISQFVDKMFQDEIQSTIGGTFSTKTIKCSNGLTLQLEIWDTAGQERYRSVTKMFYKDASVALLVYDITNKNSFLELQRYWAEQVFESSPKNIIIAIIANKSDLYEFEQVEEGEAREYANSIHALFAATSAKNNSGIDNLFIEIAKKYSKAKNATILVEKDDYDEYKKIRKESVKITKADTQSKVKNRRCC
jgi:Ras-related protein Rab-22